MEYRNFGNTDLRVSTICYGTMRYASKSGEYDEQAKAGDTALREAIDRGVNFIHSSNEYGTRWLTGRVLESHPKRRELHTDRIAVVQHLQRGEVDRALGYCAEGEPKRLSDFDSVTEPLTETFEKLRDRGKVGYLTSFPYTVGFAKRAVESGSFAGLVAYYNALETEMLDLFDEMKSEGMGFIGIRPFAAGLLTDRRAERSKLPGDDRMRSDEFERVYDQLDKLRESMSEQPHSWTDFAIRFSLSHPAITSTVVGINTPKQLEDVLQAADAPQVDAATVEAAHRICTDFRSRFGVKAALSGMPIY